MSRDNGLDNTFRDSRAFGAGDEKELDGIVAGYADRLNAGEKIRPEDILADHPTLGGEILEQLEAFVSLDDFAVSALPLGTLGDYTLRRQIGRGGMGVVYDAWQNSMNRQVALKVLPAGVAADRKAFLRFMREAQTAGQLSHQNVVAVHSTGVEQGTPWYAMEFVDGETLAQILARSRAAEGEQEEKQKALLSISRLFGRSESPEPERSTQDVEEAEPTEKKPPFGTDDQDIVYYGNVAKAFAGVADGLQHAHSKGVIHRDIKPSNLILDREGRLRILDFGLARLEGQESLTVSGDFVGTPLYMSPEQARQRKIPIDHRTDIYSLGATMYELLCGRPPFKGKDHQDTLSQIIERDPVNPNKLNRRLPKDLETVMLKCLRKDPGDRYGTAEALAQDLRRFVRGDPIEARPQGRWEVLSRRLWRYRRRVVAVSCVGLLLAVTGLFLHVWRTQRNEQDSALYEAEMERAARTLEGLTLGSSLGAGGMNVGGSYDFLCLSMNYFNPEILPGPEESSLTELMDSLGGSIERSPKKPEAYYYLAKALILSGCYDDASARLRTALEEDPRFIPARFLQRALDARLGGSPSSLARGAPPEELDEGSWQWRWREAHRAFQDRRWVKAAEGFLELYRWYQREGEPYAGAARESLLRRGYAHLQAEDFARAIHDFSAAEVLWPDALVPPMLLGVAYLLDGERNGLDLQKERAERIFSELFSGELEKRPHAREFVAVWLTWVYFGLGDETWQFWASKIPRAAQSRATTADCLIQQRLWKEAADEARAAVEEDGSLLYGRILLGSALTELGDYPGAEEQFRKIIEINDRYVAAHSYLGYLLFMQGELEEGKLAFEKARDLDPRFAVGPYLEGVACARWGMFQEAEAALRAALKIKPEQLYVLAWLGYVLMKLGRYDDARTELERALELRPDFGDAHYNLGQVEMEAGRHPAGLEHYRRAIELAPGRKVIYGTLIASLDAEKELSCAEELLEVAKAIEKHLAAIENDDVRLRAMEALVKVSLHAPSSESLSRADRWARAGVEATQGSDPHTLSILAKVLSRLRQPGEAIRTLEKACHLARARRDHRNTFLLEKELAEYRRAVKPLTYDSVDQVLVGGETKELVAEGSDWRYFRGRTEPSPSAPLAWTRRDLDHSWGLEGPSGFGYGTGRERTPLDDMRGRYTTLYIRKEFQLDDPGRYESFLLRVFADDGFIAYLNGSELARERAFRRPRHDARARWGHSPWIPDDLLLDATAFEAGRNVLALQGLNRAADNRDFFLLPLLSGKLRYDPSRDEELLEDFRREAQGEAATNLLAYLEGRVHQRAGRYEQAAAVFREVAARDPSAAEPALRLAETLVAHDEAARPEDLPREALEAAVFRADLWELWVGLLLRDGQAPPAILEALPFPKTGAGAEKQEKQAPWSHIEDLRWLLQTLAAGEDIRFNCGGDEYPGHEGKPWHRDCFYFGGRKAEHKPPDGQIRDTEDSPLYFTERWFPRHSPAARYRIPLPRDDYRVILHFAEVWSKEADRRRFHVRVEGEMWPEEIRPKTRQAEKIPVSKRVVDGFLEIEFLHGDADNPKISAIEVQCIR